MKHENIGRSLGRPRISELKQPTDELILAAAAQLFLHKGFQKVSIEEVAQACNVTKATVYYYFSTKAELYTAAMLAVMERIYELTTQMLKTDIPLHDRLLAVAESHLEATAAIDLNSYLRESQEVLSVQQMQKMKEAEERIFHLLERELEKAINNGDIRKVNAKFAAHAFLSLLRMGNQSLSSGNDLFKDSKEAAKEILDLYWKGLQI
ncbi:TetR/AcrR family transcriptional regulator [Lederbergia citrea]|uniref:TetR/AcrR family transcriptional regulator n=1 Tax=Lederbergia citrea TaxID=2833581 RepID=A0A942URS2_9BACI|nr:TetR/AcrR family transcriptional regulator [Lederbergia citrea]MBS4223583.1 TetR/AcrR family transcriptional regulator [Lederbergia citrea]